MTTSSHTQRATLTTPAPGEPTALVCLRCAHRCTLRPGEAGRCGVFIADGGRLRSLVAGHPLVQHADPVERKPLYHVWPGVRLLSLGTTGCNMHCAFCQNRRLSQAAPVQPDTPPLTPAAIIAAAREQGCAGVAFTYNEPTVWLDDALAVMHAARQDGLLTVFKTNGYLTPEARAALDGLLDAANVDLKGFSDAFYREVCGARLQPVCETITDLYRRGVWVEVTTPLIPGVNDSDADLTALAAFLADLSPDLPWHVWRFHPDYRMPDAAWTPPHALERAIAIGRAAGLHHVYASNTVGSPHQHTICPHCGTPLVTRTGYTVTRLALHRGQCPDCGSPLAGRFDLREPPPATQQKGTDL